MSAAITLLARVISVIGLTTLAVLHAVWASGSPWPARDSRRLAEAVVGQRMTMPSAAPTALVAVGSAAAAIAASGATGHGRLVRGGLHALGAVMLLRATLGGRAALAALRMPRPRKRFVQLDRRWYRPAAAILGASLWTAARRR